MIGCSASAVQRRRSSLPLRPAHHRGKAITGAGTASVVDMNMCLWWRCARTLNPADDSMSMSLTLTSVGMAWRDRRHRGMRGTRAMVGQPYPLYGTWLAWPAGTGGRRARNGTVHKTEHAWSSCFAPLRAIERLGVSVGGRCTKAWVVPDPKYSTWHQAPLLSVGCSPLRNPAPPSQGLARLPFSSLPNLPSARSAVRRAGPLRKW